MAWRDLLSITTRPSAIQTVFLWSSRKGCGSSKEREVGGAREVEGMGGAPMSYIALLS